MTAARLWLLCGAILGGTAVGLGAYRAHGLEAKLRASLRDDPASQAAVAKRLENCETAVRYQMFHALALLVVGLLAERSSRRLLIAAGTCILLGVLLFAGPLYLSSLFDRHLHWAVIPGGGLLMMVGWGLLAMSVAMGGHDRISREKFDP